VFVKRLPIACSNARAVQRFERSFFELSNLRPYRAFQPVMHRRRKGAPMRKALISLGILGALALPAGAWGTPNGTDKTNAAKECRMERGTTDATKLAFAQKYGTNGNDANAFGKCVSTRARAEESQRKAARKAARRACAARKHGKGHAYGRCVKHEQKALKRKADREDKKEIQSEQNAARTCAQEREQVGDDAFANKYGTNRNKRNAFGKCVSKQARS
jgi:hypothetical protein